MEWKYPDSVYPEDGDGCAYCPDCDTTFDGVGGVHIFQPHELLEAAHKFRKQRDELLEACIAVRREWGVRDPQEEGYEILQKLRRAIANAKE